MRLLLVEDNSSLATWLAKLLQGENYAVDALTDAESVIAGTDLGQYDIALVDLGLPGMSGLDLIREIRRHQLSLPILILTARNDLKSRVEGLNLGADDYLTKPFEIEELEARMRALLRRSHAPARREISIGPLTFDQTGRAFRLGETDLALSPREAAVLEALMRRQGQPVSKERLLESTYGFDDDVNLSAVEVIVHRLRKRLEGSSVVIATLRGLGYLLRLQE
ncbi:MAG: DNA-binding response regulator [Devosia sp. 67-54]|uniref:response regulator transcription factor n=1 Tax=unclassified Devosia TaxID=196773 RepID=UPI000965FE27|nr:MULTISPECIES: response regulator transcription factor [unclassified Devosia]MBN9306002.1 response regulator transcription factor [Devosia sp.]OJX16320.1 MAG: DNA-binding response regulator [Devosia sp. 67-54]